MRPHEIFENIPAKGLQKWINNQHYRKIWKKKTYLKIHLRSSVRNIKWCRLNLITMTTMWKNVAIPMNKIKIKSAKRWRKNVLYVGKYGSFSCVIEFFINLVA